MCTGSVADARVMRVVELMQNSNVAHTVKTGTALMGVFAQVHMRTHKFTRGQTHVKYTHTHSVLHTHTFGVFDV